MDKSGFAVTAGDFFEQFGSGERINSIKLMTAFDYNKCQVVVYITKLEESKYVFTNVVSCPANNETVDYKIEP